MKFTAASVAMLLLSAAPALADGYPAIRLYSGSTAVTGEEIAYPAAGKAHVNAMIVTLAPGGKTMLHQHGVPVKILAVYMGSEGVMDVIPVK